MTDNTISVNSELGVAAALKAKRLAEKYDKDFLSCEDITVIMDLGTNNVRQLLNSEDLEVCISSKVGLGIYSTALVW